MEKAKKRKNGLWADAFRRFKKNKLAVFGFMVVCIMVICAIFAEWIAPYYYDDQDLKNTYQFPTKEHIFGTDSMGRDIFSRIIYGTRTSLSIAIVTIILATLFGGALGAVAGYYGGKIDNILMRILDVFMAIPSTLQAIAIAAALGAGIMNTVIALVIGRIPGLARTVRAAIISIKEEEYIKAARSIGANDLHILLKHIFPNALAPILVQATLYLANSIQSIAMLSFLGLGIQPPTPEWGSMLSAGRAYMQDYWHIVTFPGLVIVLTVFSINMMGDGLRDALDPRLKN